MSTDQSALLERYHAALTGVFGRPTRVLVRGEGVHVWDADGRRYTDLLAGIAVNALGHGHPALVRAVSEQVATLGHVSNLFTSEPQIRLAERLLELAGAPAGSTVFFANSGTEANEAAFKLARRHGADDPSGRRTRVIALERAFHGRTMGALALTHKEAYRAPFEPLPGGVEHVPGGDAAALRAALAPDDDGATVAAVILEPVQGEAGVHGWPAGYLAEVRAATREAGALMILDEVQSGVGRTGTWFGFQNPAVTGAAEPVVPDAFTLAKGLGGGVPIGALVCVGPAVSGLLTAGRTAPRSAATPWPPPRAWPCSRPSRTRACSATSAPRARPWPPCWRTCPRWPRCAVTACGSASTWPTPRDRPRPAGWPPPSSPPASRRAGSSTPPARPPCAWPRR